MIHRVYEQLGALTHFHSLTIGCNVLGGPTEIEFDYSFQTGLAMGLVDLDIG